MSTQGPDNLNNDSGLDALEVIERYLLREIVYWLAPENRLQLKWSAGMRVMAAIDILLALTDHYEISPDISLPYISPRRVRYWRDTYLRMFDESNERRFMRDAGEWVAISPDNKLAPEAIAERRRVIVDTFARLEAATFDEADDGVDLP